ncbi:MAG: FAD-dependent oxidoreductase [Candidatus Lokiarchaeota archaeon]|nr:FAD-dependent oxidoreductase [Candidatus Lokiarchaeota archaeon]MBD3202186.1 FAD-dependent oxidoreductase [Candidatus Lokiarchaeota archaeon]
MLTKTHDVIIIGAGSVGVPTALFCSKLGLKTLVLEALPSVAQGDNKHAIGGIRATHSQRAKIWTSLRSIEIFSSWKEKFGDEIDWEQGGYIFLASREREKKVLQNTVIEQKNYGLNIDYVNSDKIGSLVPGINKDYIIGGTYSPEDGHASPLLALNAFYRKAIEYGTEFKFREEVGKITNNKNDLISIQTSKGKYQAQYVVNATGARAREIGNMFDLDIPVFPESHEAGITEPVKSFFSTMVVDITPKEDKIFGDSKSYYFYQTKEGQIIFCITPDPPIHGIDKSETSKFLPQISKRLINLLPRLSNIKVRRTWRGLYPMTPDGNPIIGKTAIKGFINAVGLCGQGFMLGPGLGEIIAKLLYNENKLTSREKAILEDFSLNRDFTQEEKLK